MSWAARPRMPAPARAGVCRRRRRGAWAAALLSWAAAASPVLPAPPGLAAPAVVSVFAASSLTDVLTQLGADFRAATGQAVEFNFAGSSALALQIREGARADLFISADEAKLDALESDGLIAPGTRVRLLSNALVCVVDARASWRPATAQELASPRLRRLAVAEPTTVPAGIYAKEYLGEQGIWTRVVDRVVPCENVRAVLAAVEAGDVDAGIVYRTDARISQRVRVAFEVPLDQGPRIWYPAAVLAEARSGTAAREFLAFLQTEAARARFTAAGFVAIAPPEQPSAP